MFRRCNQGLKSKIIAGYTVIFTAIFILGGMIIYAQVKGTITRNIQNELNNTTGALLNMVRTAANVSVKNYLRAVCDKTRENIEAIYQRHEAGLITEELAKEEARRIMFSQTIGKTGYIYCVSSKGVPVEHKNPDIARRSDWAENDFVKEMIRLKEGYLEYDWKNPGEEVFRPKAIYMSYFEPWDWIVSVSTYTEELKELINVNDFRKSVLELTFGVTGYSFIIDSQGDIVVHPRLRGKYDDIKALDRDAFASEMTEKKTGTLIYSWKNDEREEYRKKIVMFNYIPEYDWIVASSGYFDEFYSVLGVVKKIIIGSVLTMIVLGLFTSLWLSRYITQPLETLIRHLDLQVPDILATRMPVNSSDEIGRLSYYLNEFMNRLEAYNTHLKTEISEHKRTAEALRQSEKKYRNILSCIDEGFFEIDPDGRFTYANPSMGLITGYSLEELEETSLQHLTEDKDMPGIETLLDKREILPSRGDIFEWKLVKKDGSACFVETSLSVMTDRNDGSSGFRGVLRDVTQKIDAQRRLKLSEEMFAKAFQCSPSGMILARADNGELIRVNDSFLAFTGYDADTVLGKSLMDLAFFSNRKEGRKLLFLIREKKSLRNREIEFLRTSGEIRQGIVSAETVEIGGVPCVLAAIEDFTEVKELETEFLEMSEKERRKLAFALHDDLCPQLIGIEVLTDILKQRLESKEEDLAEFAARIAGQLQESIHKTRLLSRGLCPVDTVRYGFDAALSELVGHLEDMFGTRCHLECDGSNPFRDNSAATHAYYIAHEAVHNAIKHAEASKISICFSTQKGRSTLRIHDDGKGFGPHLTGGVGLKIMTYRAKRLNAALSIDSKPGHGTTVVLVMELDENPNDQGE